MNGQHQPNSAELAERDARIFRLKLQGLTERQIAETVGCGKTTVHDRITKAIGELVNPLAEEARALEHARLDALRLEANTVLSRARKAGDDDLRLKTIDRLLRISERAAKLDGLDAREPMEIVLKQRIEVEAEATAKAVIGSIGAVLEALPDLDPAFRERLGMYALDVAQHTLRAEAGEETGPAPQAPRPMLALPPGGTESPSPGPVDVPLPEGPDDLSEDAADAVLRELEAAREEFPDLDWSA